MMPWWGWAVLIIAFWAMVLASLAMGWIFRTGRRIDKQYGDGDALLNLDRRRPPRRDEYDRRPIV